MSSSGNIISGVTLPPSTSSDPNNLSTPSIIRPQGAAQTTVTLLPTRGEKRLIPSPAPTQITSTQVALNFSKSGRTGNLANYTPQAIEQAYSLAAALEPLTDFVQVILQNRSLDAQGNPDGSGNAVFRFLINPKTVNIGHSTLEGESFDRSGWQFGVWGEDVVRVSMQGKTAGQYFALGLTDELAEYTESFRNLEQLIDVFENNGYFFEGEQVDYGNVLTGTGGWLQGRRPIKMHQDVVLVVKEFIWYGMFETLQVSQDANNPFYADFNISFVAWKERFRGDSPYYSPIANNTERGNSYSAYQQAMQKPISVSPPPQTGANSGQPQTATIQPGGSTTAGSPAQQAEFASNSLPLVATTAMDSSPTPAYVFGAFNPASTTTSFPDFFNGVLN